MTSKAIWVAYNDCGAIDISCPNCGAEPKAWCTNEITGHARRTPCMARTVATGVIETARWRDFSEPTHASGAAR